MLQHTIYHHWMALVLYNFDIDNDDRPHMLMNMLSNQSMLPNYHLSDKLLYHCKA